MMRTRLAELPVEIGDLVHLQTLDFRYIDLKELPSTICKLSKLVRLRLIGETSVLTGVGNLSSLQYLELGGDSIENIKDFIMEVGKLTELRILKFCVDDVIDEGTKNTLLASLCSFPLLFSGYGEHL